MPYLSSEIYCLCYQHTLLSASRVQHTKGDRPSYHRILIVSGSVATPTCVFAWVYFYLCIFLYRDSFTVSIPWALICERHFSNIIPPLPLFRRNILAFGDTTAATWTTFLKRFLISTSLHMYKGKKFISANKV